jgi:hypothetical protein
MIKILWFIYNDREDMVAVKKNNILAGPFFFCLLLLAGCASYDRQVVSFKMPESSPNTVDTDGAAIAARCFITSSQAKEAFGVDICSASFLPLHVVFNNWSLHSLIIIPEQTFLIDDESNG